MGQFLSKSAFGRLAKVSASAITRAISGHYVVTEHDGSIDPENPVNLQYALKKNPNVLDELANFDPTELTKREAGSTERKGRRKQYRGEEFVEIDGEEIPAKDPIHHLAEESQLDASDLLNMTLHQVYRKFGTWRSAIDYIDSIKKLEDIQYKQVKTAAERGKLAPRERLEQLFANQERLNASLLSDMPTTISRIIMSIIETEPTQEELEELIREQCSKLVKGTKTKQAAFIKKLARSARA